MDINTDPSCNRTTDHVWSLAAALVYMIPLPQLITLANQISLALAAAKTNMVTDSSLDPMWPLVASQFRVFNSDPGCGRTMDPDVSSAAAGGRMPPWS